MAAKSILWAGASPPPLARPLHRLLGALDSQLAGRPSGSRPRSDRREMPGEGRGLAPRDRGVSAGPAQEPSLPLSRTSLPLWFLVCAKHFLLSWSFASPPFSLAHSAPLSGILQKAFLEPLGRVSASLGFSMAPLWLRLMMGEPIFLTQLV